MMSKYVAGATHSHDSHRKSVYKLSIEEQCLGVESSPLRALQVVGVTRAGNSPWLVLGLPPLGYLNPAQVHYLK